MPTPSPQCQPILERLRSMPSSLNDACRTMDEAADEIAGLREANHHYRDAVDVLEKNAREQAKLLADTGRRVEELEAGEKASRGVVAAWEMLPIGYYGARQIERWLREDMKPAIDAARAALPKQEPGS